ncbi:MAG: PIN domain-containing protein [Candidatus Woesearchaeota archaeon]|jgi:hypothetical protein
MSIAKKIILDTNFLMIPGLFGIDIVSEIDKVCDFSYELCVFDKTIDELNCVLKTATGKDKLAANIAKKLLETKRFRIIETVCDESYVDDILVKYGKDHIVATNDIKLMNRLKEKNIPILRLRQKKLIVLEK